LQYDLASLQYWLRSNSFEFWIGIALILSFVAFFSFIFKKKTKHELFVKRAYRALAKVNSIAVSAKRMQYLRKMNPYVFEELVLCAFKNLGYKIKRNRKYTGDGGIDGKVIIKGKVILIQVKRYKGHISMRHVVEFDKLCSRHKTTGLFVHTGKTGKGSKQYALQSNVSIISGSQLLSFLSGDYNPDLS
tara:strand:+ start:502 stop:1068 length:567 start_codon:yes stop_codon:yes gene_type:complete